MALIPKVEPKQEKKVVSARLDEEAHIMLVDWSSSLYSLRNPPFWHRGVAADSSSER
jgi:hypothetical protein